jgi:signal transduction histidine kinase
MDLMAYLSERSKPALLAVAFGLVGVVGVIDYLTVRPFSFELFYVVPILLAAWFVGRSAGILIAFACAGATLLSSLLTTTYHDLVPSIWNVAVQLGVFLIVAQIATALEHLRKQQEANRVASLKRADELKTTLLQAVSHDLRTPLASIKTSVTTLLDTSVPWDAAAQRALLEGIDEESDRLNRLVGNLLDMSRLEGGMLHLERDWYSINEVIHTTLRRLKPSLGSHPVEINVPDDLPLLLFDFVRVDQVLTNLIENAIKYTPPGTPIEISTRCRDQVVEVTVSDEGPGVARQHLARLFDRFYRVSGTGQPQGIGLGLSIARGMVQAHGGQIDAESRLGQGLSITFTLPLTAGTPGMPAPSSMPHESETSQSPGHSGQPGVVAAKIAQTWRSWRQRVTRYMHGQGAHPYHRR